MRASIVKPSVYNALFENDGEYVVFNTLSGALVVLDEAGVAALGGSQVEPAPQGEPALQVEPAPQEGSDLLGQLAEAGLLVPDDFDERAWMYEHYLEDMACTDYLSIRLAPTLACNLRCLYCYESHDPIRMHDDVADGIMRFIQRRWDAYRFVDLDVSWYGGEPTLEMDRIESLTSRMQEWCAERGVSYRAAIVTNASLITDDVAERLAKAGVSMAMPTLDGLQSHHDERRVAANGGGSFEQTMRGIRAMQRAGIYVGVNCNMDWVNEDDYRQLRNEFANEAGVDVFASHLRNYGGWCGGDCTQPGARGMIFECHAARSQGETAQGDSAQDGALANGAVGAAADAIAPAADAPTADVRLMTRQEYADQLFELYDEMNPDAGSLYESLRSRRHFCWGKSASYFVIDPLGNAVRCDGQMRNAEYTLFNVLDEDYPLSWPKEHGFMDPASILREAFAPEADCSTCVVAPLCMGECEWERRMFEDNCIALKYTLDRYVLKLRGFFPPLDQGEHVFAILPPRDVAALYETPFRPWAQGVMGAE